MRRLFVHGALVSMILCTVAAAPARTQSLELMKLDVPIDATIPQNFIVSGFAFAPGSAMDSPGVDLLHAWAYPLPAGVPIFLGAGETGMSRASRGLHTMLYSPGATSRAGFSFEIQNAPLGPHLIVVYARNKASGLFSNAAGFYTTIRPCNWIPSPEIATTPAGPVVMPWWTCT